MKHGPARLIMSNGDTVSYGYKSDVLDGEAVYNYASSGVREICHFVGGVKTGPSTEWNAKGDEESRTYAKGVLEGPATIKGSQGDRLEFTYRAGKRSGTATYFWADGSREISIYDDNGEETGPCKLVRILKSRSF